MRLGVDFGTTRTVVAACDRGNYPLVRFEDGAGQSWDHFPSIFAECAGEFVFGLEALSKQNEEGWSCHTSFKRLLGRPDASLDQHVRFGSSEIRLSELLGQYLSALRRALLESSSLPPRRGDKAVEVVVATPANAHSAQRFLTLEAFRSAGFEVAAMLDEPSAAGVEYAHRYQKTITTKRDFVLVYDLGGGTFDASLLCMRDRDHEVVASSGIAQLGGDDFDEVLFGLTLAQLELEPDALSAPSRYNLRAACRDQKERINPNTRRVLIDVGASLTADDQAALGLSLDASVAVAVADFEHASAPLVKRTLEEVERVARLGEEDLLQQVAGLYVVGGGSCLPFVARALRDSYGRRVHRALSPSASTAMGLAIAVDGDSGYGVRQRFARHFGVFRENACGSEVLFDPIFGAKHPLPASAGSAPPVVRKYRPSHNLGHFRFVECSRLADNGTPTGDITHFAEALFPFDPELRSEGADLERVPVTRTSLGPWIEERYSLDAAGIVNLDIVDTESGFARHFRLGSGLSP